MPLPPYIRGGNMVDADVANYQTVFAQRPGAIAAPTAGLHFTSELLQVARSARRGTIRSSRCTSAWARFGRSRAATLDEHRMHRSGAKSPRATADELNATRAAGGRVIAVGTTVVAAVGNGGAGERDADSSSPSASRTPLPPGKARPICSSVRRSSSGNRCADDEFHFPRTTLLVLVQTFGGRELDCRGVSAGNSRRVSLLQLRRCDADRVTRFRRSAGDFWPAQKNGSSQGTGAGSPVLSRRAAIRVQDPDWADRQVRRRLSPGQSLLMESARFDRDFILDKMIVRWANGTVSLNHVGRTLRGGGAELQTSTRTAWR